MPPDISILISTHNRVEMLSRALESLRRIDLPPAVSVELLIIANACTDSTAQRVSDLAASLPFPARCVEEPRLGLTNARNRAVAEARGRILAFLDDDIWVQPAWLAALLDVFNSRPADIVGGEVVLWWEAVAKPAWMDTRSEHLLSCVGYGDRIIELHTPGLAVGANFAVKRELFDRLGGFSILGRTPEVPLSGDETEFLARALHAGYRMFYAPCASVKHWVAPHRIELPYLSAVAYCNGLVRPFLRPTMPWHIGIKTMAEYGYRFLAYTFLEFLAAILFQRKMRIHHRIRKMTSWGNVVGAWRRLAGHGPAAPQ